MLFSKTSSSLLRSFLCSRAASKRHYAQSSKGSAPSVPTGPVYELRIYSIRPEKFADFRQLMTEKFHIRTAFSKMLGYWIADLGGIFQAVHIWPYESVSHRAEIRQAMAKDKVWNEDFLANFLPCTSQLDNTLLVLTPGTKLNTDFQPSPTAAYELLSLTGQGDCGSEPLVPLSDQETIVGRFRSVYGDINTEYRLMRYPDPDSAFTHARQRLENNPNLKGFSRYMVPHDSSEIK